MAQLLIMVKDLDNEDIQRITNPDEEFHKECIKDSVAAIVAVMINKDISGSDVTVELVDVTK